MAAKAAPYVTAAGAGVFFVDWAAVKEQLGASDLSSKSSDEQKLDFYNERLRQAADIGPLRVRDPLRMAELVGFDPADFDWEASIEASGAPVGVMGFAEDFDLAAVESALEKCGYQETAGAGETLWSIGPVESCGGKKDEIGTRTPGPALSNIAVLADEHVLVAGGSPDAVGAAVKGGDDAFASSVEDLDGTLDDVVAGYLGTGRYACELLGFRETSGRLTPEIEQRLKQRLGDVGPRYQVLMAGYVPKGDGYTGRVALDYEDAGQAEDSLDARKAAFEKGTSTSTNQPLSDLLRLTGAEAEDDALVFSVAPRSGPLQLNGMITRRDLMFAGC